MRGGFSLPHLDATHDACCRLPVPPVRLLPCWCAVHRCSAGAALPPPRWCCCGPATLLANRHSPLCVCRVCVVNWCVRVGVVQDCRWPGAEVQKLVETEKHLVFPLVYRMIELALVLPVATASVERVFSAMKTVKTDLCNRMGDEWMNDSLVVYIEKDIFSTIENEQILQHFQQMQSPHRAAPHPNRHLPGANTAHLEPHPRPQTHPEPHLLALVPVSDPSPGNLVHRHRLGRRLEAHHRPIPPTLLEPRNRRHPDVDVPVFVRHRHPRLPVAVLDRNLPIRVHEEDTHGGGRVQEGSVGLVGDSEASGVERLEAEGGEPRLEPEIGEPRGDRDERGREEGRQSDPATKAAAAAAGAVTARRRLPRLAERRGQRPPPGRRLRSRRWRRRRVAVAGRLLQLRLQGKPIWQIFLNFLYRRNYWAVVSVSDSEDHSIQGILMPFTPNHALLAIKKNNLLNPGQLIVKKTKRIIEMRESFTEKNEMLNAPASAESKEEPTRRNNKMHQNQIQNATLNSFRKMAFSKETDSLGFDLEQLYFSRNSDKSKKLKFLKCWMRQIVKSNSDCQFIWDDLTEHLDTKEDSQIRTAVSDSQIRTAASQDEPEPDVIPSSMDDAYPSGSPNNDMAMLQHMEDTDAFLRGIPQKIQQGLCSQDADLGMLAERIVDLCIRALDMQFNENTKNLFSDEAGDASYGKIANELSHLLLMKPKDLTLKYKVMNSANNASQNAVSDLYTREYKIREHELQILLRMELLCSIVAPNIEEDAKQKMIKEICSLLQFIDINLQGESFGYQHIVDYTERTIKQRYSHCLGEIICKIYNQMEFNLFDDEVEASDSLPSSNNEEFKRLNEHTVGATGFGMQQEEMQNKQQRRLIKAQELRDRERRLSSFTSFIPDLKKVWAPKRLKAERLTHDSQTKLSKRRRRVSTSDRVCETPMTGLKNHSRVQADGSSCQVSNSKPFSKALFHHDSELNSDAAL
ncbi:uncharacterized protein LOC122019633 [Zingiber officinale]|uniref:uncharacterized protein LOC122019633 n=1 Tax=Zingiber officinale TaxID=94328 RepID=UPI001C4D497E|nr:uncharacterized protein LOC122019633 [Zingiber officinale]